MNYKELKYQISLILVDRSSRELSCTSEEYGNLYDSEAHEKDLRNIMSLIEEK